MVCDPQKNGICDDINSSQHHVEEVMALRVRRHAAVTVQVRSRNNHILQTDKPESSLPFHARENAMLYSRETSRVENSFSKSKTSSSFSENSFNAKSALSLDDTKFCEPDLKTSYKRLFFICRLYLTDFQFILRRNLAKQIPNYLHFILLLQFAFTTAAVVHTIVPVIRTDATKQSFFNVFSGGDDSVENDELHFQLFKYIEEWEKTFKLLLVGSRSYLYMFELLNDAKGKKLSYSERLRWFSTNTDKAYCKTVLRSDYECKNYIRAVELLENKTLLVCGSNAFRPRCRTYLRSDFASKSKNSIHNTEDRCIHGCEISANPTASNVLLYTNTSRGYRIIAALNGGPIGAESRLIAKGDIEPTLITSKTSWFNNARYIKILQYKNGKTYLFYREITTAAETYPALATYSRIAQICSNDTGGESVSQQQWTSFLSARLKCSFTTDDRSRTEEFQFDNLTSVSDVIQTERDGKKVDVVFATFTTPDSWRPIEISAVCLFAMDDIIKAFDSGTLAQIVNFAATNSLEGSGTRHQVSRLVDVKHIPGKRPGKCTVENETVSNEDLNFARTHPSMLTAVTPFLDKPIFVSDINVKMTSIAVDSNAGENGYTVLYIGTDCGKLMRIRIETKNDRAPLYLEEMFVSKDGAACQKRDKACDVLALHIFRPDSRSQQKPSILVAFTHTLVQVPLSLCHKYTDERCCNLDPECGWMGEKCVLRLGSTRKQTPTSDTLDVPKNCSADYVPPKTIIDKITTTTTTTTTTTSATSIVAPVSTTSIILKQSEMIKTKEASPPVLKSECNSGYFIAAIIGAILAEVVTVTVVIFLKRKNRSRFADGISQPMKMQHYVDAEFDTCTEPRQSQNFNQSGSKLMRNGDKKDNFFAMVSNRRPSSIVKEQLNEVPIRNEKVFREDDSFSDIPQPSAGNEKAFLLMEDIERKDAMDNDWIPFVEAESQPEFPNSPIDLSPNFATADTLPLLGHKDGEIAPSKLFLNHDRFNKIHAISPQDIRPLSNVNANCNTSIMTKPSPLNFLPFSPPPSVSDKKEMKKSENNIISTSDKSLMPTFKSPPLPKIQKLETFSGLIDQKKKPSISLKSAAVLVRSASRRTGPPLKNHPSALGNTFSLNNEEIQKARRKRLEKGSLKNRVANLLINNDEKALRP